MRTWKVLKLKAAGVWRVEERTYEKFKWRSAEFWDLGEIKVSVENYGAERISCARYCFTDVRA